MDLITNLFSGWGAIVVAICIMLGTALHWPKWLNYIWALLVLLAGVLSL